MASAALHDWDCSSSKIAPPVFPTTFFTIPRASAYDRFYRFDGPAVPCFRLPTSLIYDYSCAETLMNGRLSEVNKRGSSLEMNTGTKKRKAQS
jgi:hypothetical protein